MGREVCWQGKHVQALSCPFCLRDWSPFSSCQAPPMDLWPEKGEGSTFSRQELCQKLSLGLQTGLLQNQSLLPEKKPRKLPAPGSQCDCWGFSRDWCSGKPGTVRLGGCVMPWGPCATLPWGYDVPAAPHLGCPENTGQLNRVKVFGGVRLEPVGDERRAGGSTKALAAEFAASPNPLWAVVWDLCSRAAFSIAPDAIPAALWSRGVSTSLNPLHPRRGTIRSDP